MLSMCVFVPIQIDYTQSLTHSLHVWLLSHQLAANRKPVAGQLHEADREPGAYV